MPEELFGTIAQEFENEHATTTGQMFGKRCLKVNGKAFAAFFQEQMVFKIGQEEIRLLKDKYTGSVNWDPSGKNRAMKDWLQVPFDYQDDWTALAKQAMDFVINNK